MRILRSQMAAVLLSVCAALAVVGCGHSAERKLQGRWYGEQIESVAPEDLSAATGWVKGTSFVFKGETLTVEIPAEAPRSGRFEVLAQSSAKITLAVHRPDGATDEVNLKLDGERSMRWLLPQGRSIVMGRTD